MKPVTAWEFILAIYDPCAYMIQNGMEAEYETDDAGNRERPGYGVL